MRLLTRLPRNLREQLEMLDAAPNPGPPLSEVDIRTIYERIGGPAPAGLEGPTRVPVGSPPAGLDHLERPCRRPMLVLVSAVAVILLLAGGISALVLSHGNSGHTQANNTNSSLYGPTWANTDGGVTVTFTRTTAVSTLVCTKETRRLTVHGHHLHLGQQVQPLVSCSYPAPTHRAEAIQSRFGRILASTPEWSVSGGTLTLTSPAGESLRFHVQHK
jgi:hypothetical protein